MAERPAEQQLNLTEYRDEILVPSVDKLLDKYFPGFLRLTKEERKEFRRLYFQLLP